MTANDVLIVRLEMAAQTLRLAGAIAKNKTPDMARRITSLEADVDALAVLANPTLRCKCDPDTCVGCVDCSCLN